MKKEFGLKKRIGMSGSWLTALDWLVPLGIAALLRIWNLSLAALRADTIIFWDLCRNPGLSAGTIYLNWISLVGSKTSQFPTTPALIKAFLDVSHLPVTEFTIRLPMAIFGSLAVIPAYYAGRLLGGRLLGIVLALILAINPFHIQASMEAYFYGPMLLGSSLLLWSCLWMMRYFRLPVWPKRFYAASLAGVLLSAHSHLSGCWLCILWGTVWGTVMICRIRWGLARWSHFGIALGILGGCALPLIFMPWGVPDFWEGLQSSAEKSRIVRTFGQYDGNWMRVFWSYASAAGWGRAGGRGIWTAFILISAIISLFVRGRTLKMALVLAGVIAGAMVILHFSSKSQGTPPNLRYLLFIQPFFLLWMAQGIFRLPVFLKTFSRLPVRLRRMPAWLALGWSLLILAAPAYTSTQLTGKPIPYKRIAAWCDTQLPPHTLVLVERWFDPWNELRVYNSTNVFFTFTVPAEPEDVFKQFNWPATAKAFFEKFPDAAYLEYGSSGRARMGVVTNWHFARQVVFTNVAGIKLAQMGVAYRDDFYDAHTNRVISTIFYNTREDTVAHARKAGQPYLILYGPEWGYVKLWQQLKDFRDWRILEHQAALDVYNLTASTNQITLKIRGMTLNGSKRVSAWGGENRGEYQDLSRFKRDFRHLQLEEWALKDITLRPGLNKIIFSDSLWSTSKIPLLVDQIEASPLP